MINAEAVKYGVIFRVSPITVYRHLVTVDIHHTEIIGLLGIGNVPENRVHYVRGAGVRAGAAGTIEKLNDIVLPGRDRWIGLWVWRDATVNGLPGIEMLMPAGKEVKAVLIQERPQ